MSTEEKDVQPELPYELLEKTGSRTAFRNNKEIKAATQTFRVPYEMIKPRPGFNIRTEENDGFSVASLMELSEQIVSNGLTPITGDLTEDGKTFYIEDGERRWRAIGLLRERDIAYDMVEVLPNPSSKTEKERMLSMLSSSNKVPYRPIEIAEGIYRLKKFFEMSNQEIGDSLGKSRQWVDGMITLAKKPEDVKDQVRSGSLSPTDAIHAPQRKMSAQEEMNGITGKSKRATTKDRTIGEGSGSDIMNDVTPEKETTPQEDFLNNITKNLGKLESLTRGLNDQAQVDADNYLKWIRNDIDALNLFFAKRENRDTSKFITVESVNDLVKLVDTNRISDGYHSFGELYDQRVTLFIALCYSIQESENALIGHVGGEIEIPIWKSRVHSDGTSFDGWFVMGINKEPGKQITYHLPDSEWDNTSWVPTLIKAPDFDGHTSADVLLRIKQLSSYKKAE